MRKFLTLRVSFFWMLLGLLSFANTASAQDYYIVITQGDDAIKGDTFKVGVAAYRDFCLEGIPAGEISTQICEPILAGDAANPAALIDLDPITAQAGYCERGGGIAFDTKAMNIQNAGAEGMLLANNDQANPNNVLNYGTKGAVTNFWGLSVSYNSGQILKLYPGFSFVIITKAVAADTDVIIWEGEGEFDGGLAPWTTVGISCGGADQDGALAVWNWAADGSTQGLYGGTKINSPTVCNGAAFFNSDLYDTNATAQGDGPCSANQEGELISPIIDLSAYPEETAITMKFTQVTRQYQSEYFVGWSNDGGETWTEIPINTGIVLNSGYENSTQRIKLTGAVPTANFRLKFRYVGNYYFWIVDDVKLVEPEDYNALIDPNWMTTAPYPTMPLSQAVPVQFMTDVHNIGGKSLTSTELKAVITNEANEEVYSETVVLNSVGAAAGTVFSGDTIQNTIFGSYLPTEEGDYKVTYSVSTEEEDFDATNNSYSKTFTVTNADNGEWGREDGITRNISLAFADGVRIDWAYSNVFRAENAGSAKNVKFNIANADDLGEIGGTAQFYIYECEDLNGDFIYTDDEHDVVGFNYFDVPAGSAANLEVDLPIRDFGTEEVINLELKEGKVYVLSLVYQAPESAPTTSLFWSSSDKINQRATEFIGEAQGDYVCTHELHTPWELDGPIDCSTARSVFSGTPVPYARFGVGTLAKKDLKLADNTFTVFPTNTRDNVSVAFNFANATDATMEVYDINGKRLSNNKLENQKDQTNVINVGQFAQGTYFVRVTTPNGTLSKPFNVIK